MINKILNIWTSKKTFWNSLVIYFVLPCLILHTALLIYIGLYLNKIDTHFYGDQKIAYDARLYSAICILIMFIILIFSFIYVFEERNVNLRQIAKVFLFCLKCIAILFFAVQFLILIIHQEIAINLFFNKHILYKSSFSFFGDVHRIMSESEAHTLIINLIEDYREAFVKPELVAKYYRLFYDRGVANELLNEYLMLEKSKEFFSLYVSAEIHNIWSIIDPSVDSLVPETQTDSF